MATDIVKRANLAVLTANNKRPLPDRIECEVVLGVWNIADVSG